MAQSLLKLGIPKGSLQEATVEMFKKAGYSISISSRSYYPWIDDEEISLLLIRAQEIARYVEEGVIDAGLTGFDWVVENDADIHTVSQLVYSKVSKKPVRWVLCVHEDSPYQSVKDLEGKRVATEVVNLTRKYFKSHNVHADIEFSWGATEVKCPTLVDAIVEVTETGSSLRANNLRIIDEVLVSNTQLIANKDSWNDIWKKNKLEKINMLLQGVLEAEGKVGIQLNIEKSHLTSVIDILPALKKPTVSMLSDENFVAVNTIIEEHTIRDLIPQLKEIGATDIVEYPLNKIIR